MEEIGGLDGPVPSWVGFLYADVLTVGFDPSEAIGWTLDARMRAFEDVRVDHGGPDVDVTQEFLDGSYVRSCLKKMCCEGMPECVTSYFLGDAGA